MEELKVISLGAGSPSRLQALAGRRCATVSAMAERTAPGPAAAALMAFGDEPKPGQPRRRLQALHAARHSHIVMISGDNLGAATAMALAPGPAPEQGEVMAEVLPGDKAEQVARL